MLLLHALPPAVYSQPGTLQRITPEPDSESVLLCSEACPGSHLMQSKSLNPLGGFQGPLPHCVGSCPLLHQLQATPASVRSLQPSRHPPTRQDASPPGPSLPGSLFPSQAFTKLALLECQLLRRRPMTPYLGKTTSWDFPGGPGAEPPHSQCRGPKFYPWSGN